MDSILKRRSIRKYKPDFVDDKEIYEIIKAGMNAPAARNLKSSEFIIIKNRIILNQIIEKNPHAGMLKEAPIAIVVCGKEVSEFWVQDLSAATENILIKATEFGLGTCWVGIYPIETKEKDLKDLLKIPDDIRAFSLISLGYPEEEKESNSRFDTGVIHRDEW